MFNSTTDDDKAVNSLIESGADLIRLRHDKAPQEPRHWPAYQRSSHDLLDHDGLLGLLPESIGCTVLDVDIGDASRLVASFPPLSSTKSRRLDGSHLYYRHRRPIPNQAWCAPVFGAGGDIKSRRAGYVVLWSASRLVRDLELDRPAATMEDVQAALVVGTPQGPPASLQGPERDANAETVPTPQGRHNHVLQRLIAARCDGMDPASIRRYAVHLWRSLPAGDHPFTWAEVACIADWVGRHRWDSVTQRQRGIRSGIARRTRTASRDRQIADSLAAGLSIRGTARKLGVTPRTVQWVRERLREGRFTLHPK